MTVLLAILLSFAILLGLLWLLFGSKATETSSDVDNLEIEKLLPVKCRHFPQITQMLKQEDSIFMRKRAPHHIEREWRAERRRILGQYLKGLRQDFTRIERLARLIAALSPEVRKGQEWEWMRLGVQFHLSYRIVALKIALGSLSPDGLARLTELISGLASQLENRMSLIAEYSPARLRANVGS
ncbi:MAG: hypothetical protein ACRD37_11035 [Candidatus Acidiferrales bacterium]